MSNKLLSLIFAAALALPITARAQVQFVPNANTTGTATGQIAKVTGAPSTAVRVGTTDTTWNGVVLGETTTTATTGNALLAIGGQVNCIFDGATTAGDFVQISSTTAGDCHDAGATFPTTGSQIVGIVLSTNASAGTYTINVFSPGIPAAGAGSITSLTQDVSASGSGAVAATVLGGNYIFCGGGDGNIAGGAGTTTLTRDTCYNNVTLQGSDQIITAGYRLFVAGTLDISAAPANAIIVQTSAGRNGGSAADGVTTGGTASTALLGSLPACPTTSGGGGAGSTGSGGTGQVGTPSAAQGPMYGGVTTTGVAGGAGSNAGGSGGASPGAATAYTAFPYPGAVVAVTFRNSGGSFQGTLAGDNAAGSGAGGGDGTHAGGAGGAGGGCGGMLFIAARTIARGTNSTAGIIAAQGGNGGNGAKGNASCTNCGGGSGGNGGGGGWIHIVVGSLTGSTITNALDASSGAGGTGGLHLGTGSDGTGGTSGASGGIEVLNLSAGTYNNTAPGTTFNTGSGTTGGASKTAQQSL